jgi:hypothetical protein
VILAGSDKGQEEEDDEQDADEQDEEQQTANIESRGWQGMSAIT